MRVLLRLSQGIDALIERIGALLNWIVLILIAIGFLNEVARRVRLDRQLAPVSADTRPTRTWMLP